MPPHRITDLLPDLTVLVHRDGTVLDHVGGRGIVALSLAADAVGGRIDTLWPEPAARAIRQLVKQAIAQRKAVEACFKVGSQAFDARAMAQGPDRALCTLRTALSRPADDTLETTGIASRPELDRRGFLRRFRESISQAALREAPASVAAIHLDGVAQIARVLDSREAELVVNAALLRLSAERGLEPEEQWYLGQLDETSIALVMQTADREAIEILLGRICGSLRAPVTVGDSAFQITPYAGVAISGQDANSAKALLDHARSASAEACRGSMQQPLFFTDTLRLRSLSRLDIAREIREAIEQKQIGLRFIGRHHLATGELLARVAYLRWQHPLRGEVRPAEFLAVAETTGLAVNLSRAAMGALTADLAATTTGAETGPDGRITISFGPLRHHLLHEEFIADVGRLLTDSGAAPERLEIRLSERSFVALDPGICRALRRLGVQLVVDEVGRGLGSLDKLARAPLHGVQLDRAWVTSVGTDEVARRVCRAGISTALALDLTPIATGIDEEEQRDTLLDLGCREGSGDFFAPGNHQIAQDAMRRA